MKDLRVVFMGTPEFAVPILKGLIENVDVILVVSQPDKPVGRKKILTPSPIKSLAEEEGIEVFTPNKIREDYLRIVKSDPDLIVTCAYGQIIPKELLDYPKYGCINVHASLLPKLRGGAPIHRAIIEGYEKTGITIMYMDEHMDSGDIISQRETDIAIEDTVDSLSARLKIMGRDLLLETLPCIIDGSVVRQKQNENEVTFCPIIKKEDEKIDFSKTTKEVYDHIRGLNSTPGAYFTMNGKHIKVYSSKMGSKKGPIGQVVEVYKDGFGVGTSDGEIIITEIKPEGKNRIAVRDYLNGISKDGLLGVKLNDELS